jgi:hypothetical protein
LFAASGLVRSLPRKVRSLLGKVLSLLGKVRSLPGKRGAVKPHDVKLHLALEEKIDRSCSIAFDSVQTVDHILGLRRDMARFEIGVPHRRPDVRVPKLPAPRRRSSRSETTVMNRPSGSRKVPAGAGYPAVRDGAAYLYHRFPRPPDGQLTTRTCRCVRCV